MRKSDKAGAPDVNALGEIADILNERLPVTLPPKLRENLLARIRRSQVAALPAAQTIREAAREWQETAYSGIQICRLFDDTPEGHGAILVRMAPGARYPDHEHKNREQFYVIEGDVIVGDDILYAGDYHRAEGGTRHDKVSTKNGCMCIILGYVGSILAP